MTSVEPQSSIPILADDEYTMTETEGGTPRQTAIEKEHIFKVVVVGSYSVGKTTLIRRLLGARLPPGHGASASDTDVECSEEDHNTDFAVTPTVGTDFYSCVVKGVVPHRRVRLQIWDTAGLPALASVDQSTFRHASLIMCVFDVSDPKSLQDVTTRHLAQAAEYIPDLEQHKIVVVANKVDLLQKSHTTRELRYNQRRAATPEAAFLHEDIDDEPSEPTSSPIGADDSPPAPSLVTVEDVQDNIMEVFPEVRYAEVSAKALTGVSVLLETLCGTLLCNEGLMPTENARFPTCSPTMAHSMLPSRHTAAPLLECLASPVENTVLESTAMLPPSPDSVTHTAPSRRRRGAADTRPPPPPPPIAVPSEVAKVLESGVEAPARTGEGWPPASSTWRVGMSFDMQPTPFADSISAGIFSPQEGAESSVSVPHARPATPSAEVGGTTNHIDPMVPPARTAGGRAGQVAQDRVEMAAILSGDAACKSLGGPIAAPPHSATVPAAEMEKEDEAAFNERLQHRLRSIEDEGKRGASVSNPSEDRKHKLAEMHQRDKGMCGCNCAVM